jgi:peptidoglycan hydrolase-like protein with peptidoglycan-binding domain
MRRSRGPLLLALLLTAGCFHARKVAEPDRREDEAGRTAGSTKEKGSSPERTPSRVPPRGDRPAVSSSPEELMNPGSARRIQDALRSRGYLDEASGRLDRATSVAVRRFQEDQGLAETGVPDRETLRRLGLDPSTVYQSAPGGAAR